MADIFTLKFLGIDGIKNLSGDFVVCKNAPRLTFFDGAKEVELKKGNIIRFEPGLNEMLYRRFCGTETIISSQKEFEVNPGQYGTIDLDEGGQLDILLRAHEPIIVENASQAPCIPPSAGYFRDAEETGIQAVVQNFLAEAKES